MVDRELFSQVYVKYCPAFLKEICRLLYIQEKYEIGKLEL